MQEDEKKSADQKRQKASFAIFTFKAQGIDTVSIKLKIAKDFWSFFIFFGEWNLFKSHRKHVVLFCRGWEINGAALYQANNYKWIAWYPIKKPSLPLSPDPHISIPTHRRHRETEHGRSSWSHARQIAVSRTGGNFPEIRNISGKWKKKSSTWAAPWRHGGTITSKMSAFRKVSHSHQAIWRDRRRGKIICTFITGWLQKGYIKAKKWTWNGIRRAFTAAIDQHIMSVSGCACT